MENIQTFPHSKQPIKSYFNGDTVLIALWGGNLNFRFNSQSQYRAFHCIGLLEIGEGVFLILNSDNNLLKLENMSQITQLATFRYTPLVYALNQSTCLFMHNTIQQQNFLCLLNLKTDQRKTYIHSSDISQICAYNRHVLVGDCGGYLSLISEISGKLKMIWKQRLFKTTISHIKTWQGKILVGSGKELKILDTQINISIENDISSLEVHNEKLFIGTIKGELIIIDESLNEQKFEIHNNPISSIAFNNNNILTSSYDRTTKIWKC